MLRGLRGLLPLRGNASDAASNAAAGILSGMPEGLRQRVALISSPCRTPEQQGTQRTGRWRLSFPSNQAKWANPLMGWTSSADPLANFGLWFSTKEAAVSFAKNQGWEFEIEEPKQSKSRIKSYADNFAFVRAATQDEF